MYVRVRPGAAAGEETAQHQRPSGTGLPDRLKAGGQSALPVIPAPVAIVRVRIIGSVLLTLGLPDYRALTDVCLSQLTS